MQHQNAQFGILYLFFTAPLSPGVHKKLLGFFGALHHMCRKSQIRFKGININAIENDSDISWHGANPEYFTSIHIPDRSPRFLSNIRTLKAFFRVKPIFNAAYREINRFKPDVIILRYYMLEVPAPFNPKRTMHDVVFISEHNSKETEELSNIFNFSLLPVVLERLKSRMFFKNVDAIIGVTSEIANYQIKRSRRSIPYFVLTNGIDVNRHLMKRYLDFSGNELKMIFVSSDTSVWHGLERLLMGIEQYTGDVRLELNIVGPVSPNITRLIKRLNLEHNIIFHGSKFGKSLDKIFDNMHIGIGTLALHRNNLKYGSTLKTREYMARGIPFIIGYLDEDIADEFPFVLQVQADNSPLDLKEIIAFAKNIYHEYGNAIPLMMRDYALKKMDYKAKVKGLLDFILKLAA